MKASDLMIRCLEEEGVERIFGVPGEENADFRIYVLRVFVISQTEFQSRLLLLPSDAEIHGGPSVLAHAAASACNQSRVLQSPP